MSRWVCKFEKDYHDTTLDGHIFVAYEPFEPLRGAADQTFAGRSGWVRLVIWDNSRTNKRSAHVNIDSDAKYLIRAALQNIDDGTSLYLVKGTLVRRQGKDLWPDDLPVPPELS